MFSDQKNYYHYLSIEGLLVLMILIIGPVEAIYADAGTFIRGTITVLDKEGNIKKDHSNVVIFLDELEQPPAPDLIKKSATMDQINKTFTPEVLPILAGTTVDFPNNDVIFHNVFSLSKTKSFDLGLYKQGDSRSVTFDNPGLVKIYCNIHPEMLGYILVLNNPYFAVSNAEGSFALPAPQQGGATIRTWYAKTSEFPEKRIHITPEGIKDLDFKITEDLRFRIKEEMFTIKHKNKWGQDYPSKY